MRKLSLTALGLLAMVLMAGNAFAYVVDGLVSTDWGINLGLANNAGYLNTNRPSGATVDVVTEDNTSSSTGWFQVGPGWSYGNTFDAEAMYFDNDQNNAYIAVITGLPLGGASAGGSPSFRPGDIGLDFNNDGVYEYGIDVDTGWLYSGLTAANWNGVVYPQFNAAAPWTIASGSTSTPIEFVYSGNQNDHYVLEAGIPLSALPADAKNVNVHWTMQCGNDVLNLPANVSPVPEPATMSLLGLGILGLFGMKKRFS